MDLQVTQMQLEIFVSQLMAWAATALPAAIGAIILLVAGLWFAGFAQRSTSNVMNRSGRVDETLSTAIASIVRYTIIVLVIVAVLGQLGVPMTSVLAALGAAGLAIGLALQGTLANVAAGFMILWLRPFKVGDYIDANGPAGTVKHIGLFNSELHSWDGIYQFVPNSELWNSRVINYTRLPTRLLQLQYGIAYSDDIGKAKSILEKMISDDSRVLDDPAPQVMVQELGDSAVVLAIRVWTRTTEYWALKWDLTEAGKLRLDEAGFTIPFPQRDIHLYSEKNGGGEHADA